MSAALCPAGSAENPCSHGGKVRAKGLCSRHYRQTPEQKAYQRAYRQTPERKAYGLAYRQTPERKADKRANALLRKYGITTAAYDALLAGGPFGSGRCWNCPTDAPGGNGVFHVDHDRDHPGVSRGVRGILCYPCNRRHGEGNDMDTIEGARRWLAYLTNGPARVQRIIAETEDELAAVAA